jgi:hypothetical protein
MSQRIYANLREEFIDAREFAEIGGQMPGVKDFEKAMGGYLNLS